MSLNGPVVTPQHDLFEGYVVNYFAKVINVNTVRRDDCKWESYSGLLQLRCFLNLVKVEGDFSNPRLVGAGMEHLISLNLDTPAEMDAADIFFVPVHEVIDPILATRKGHCSEGSGIIVRLLDQASGTYSRCGLARISAWTDRDTGRFPHSWLSLISARGKELLPCNNFDFETGHLINII